MNWYEGRTDAFAKEAARRAGRATADEIEEVYGYSRRELREALLRGEDISDRFDGDPIDLF